ncbi:MAG: hypothetical protein IAF38_04675 [Bacteroidia bacterium]|nr:hypothetical protein [Bacteroidia bacterium]
MIKIFAPIVFSLLLLSCGTYRDVKSVFAENRVEQRRVLDTLPLPAGKSFFVIVFNEADSARLNEPIAKTLQIDSTEDGADTYGSLAQDYVVVKLFRKEFERLLSDSLQCKIDSASRADYPTMGLTKSFVFITDSWYIRIYGQKDLDSPKEYIHDLISVGFGP